MAIYAIGDIHGCYNVLVTLFNNILYSENDEFVFLGDYVYRGNHTKEKKYFYVVDKKELGYWDNKEDITEIVLAEIIGKEEED